MVVLNATAQDFGTLPDWNQKDSTRIWQLRTYKPRTQNNANARGVKETKMAEWVNTEERKKNQFIGTSKAVEEEVGPPPSS